MRVTYFDFSVMTRCQYAIDVWFSNLHRDSHACETQKSLGVHEITFLNKDLGPTSQFSIIVWFVSKSHFQKKIVNSSIIQVLYNSAACPYLLALLFYTEGVDFSLFLANLLSLKSRFRTIHPSLFSYTT